RGVARRLQGVERAHPVRAVEDDLAERGRVGERALRGTASDLVDPGLALRIRRVPRAHLDLVAERDQLGRDRGSHQSRTEYTELHGSLRSVTNYGRGGGRDSGARRLTPPAGSVIVIGRSKGP